MRKRRERITVSIAEGLAGLGLLREQLSLCSMAELDSATGLCEMSELIAVRGGRDAAELRPEVALDRLNRVQSTGSAGTRCRNLTGTRSRSPLKMSRDPDELRESCARWCLVRLSGELLVLVRRDAVDWTEW